MPAPNPAKICIVSSELNRLFRNGGIGTASTGLAQLLAEHGHRVTVLYTGALAARERASFHTFADFYARELGISLVLLRESPLLGPGGPRFAARALSVYHQLQDGDWDAIFFNDVNAEGYYCVTAKRVGMSFEQTALCVVAHGPRTWVRELNRWPVTCGDDLENVFMERETARFADHLVSPSQYMLDWLVGDGWRLTSSTHVNACRLPQWPGSLEDRPRSERSPVRELVFFGRLEYRKGVTLFCDAIDALARDHAGLMITFLGKFGDVLGVHGGGYVLRRARDWPFDLRFLPRLDQPEALDYLRARPAALPVIPSLVDNLPCVVSECLQQGLPFVATRTGGIPELVAQADRARCLCAPDPASLAAVIRPTIEAAPEACRPARTSAAIDAGWTAILEQVLAPRSPRRVDVPPESDVEVVVGPVSARDLGSGPGEYVLLVDEGVELSPDAIGRLLRGAVMTGADITTAFAYDRTREASADAPRLAELSVGNAREAGYYRDVFGGRPALVRKRALVESGLLDEEGFGRDMWASHCEASFAGLEIVCVPAPLAWAAPAPHARRDAAADHGPVRDVFERHAYRDCELLQDLLVGFAQPASGPAVADPILDALDDVDPQSDRALTIMARYGEETGRPQTASELRALVDARAKPLRSERPAPPELVGGDAHWELAFTSADLASVALAPGCAPARGEHGFPLVRADRPSAAVQVHPVLGREISGTVSIGTAKGLREVRATAFLGHEQAPAVEFRLAVARAGAGASAPIAASAWTRVEEPEARIPLRLSVPALDSGEYELVLSTRLPGDRMSFAHARFGDIHLSFGGPVSDDGAASA